MENPQTDANQKLDDYELTKELEVTTPEEQTQDHVEKLFDLGVGTSSVGNEVFTSVQEQEAHEAALAKEYEAVNRDSHFDVQTTTDDARLFHHTDSPQAMEEPRTERERQEEKALVQKEDQIEMTSEVAEEDLSRDPDREPFNPAVGQTDQN
jgi:hypothetical protein